MGVFETGKWLVARGLLRHRSEQSCMVHSIQSSYHELRTTYRPLPEGLGEQRVGALHLALKHDYAGADGAERGQFGGEVVTGYLAIAAI